MLLVVYLIITQPISTSLLIFKPQLADPSENDTTMIGPLLGFAKQGSAEGKLLYVNYGRSEDFQVLKSNFSISNCSGYIVIMRFGKIFRGDKVRDYNKETLFFRIMITTITIIAFITPFSP
jgi:hypothetical protein